MLSEAAAPESINCYCRRLCSSLSSKSLKALRRYCYKYCDFFRVYLLRNIDLDETCQTDRRGRNPYYTGATSAVLESYKGTEGLHRKYIIIILV